MDRLIKTSGKIWRSFSFIAAIFMVFSVAVIMANIILRRFFNAPIFGSTEIIQYAGLVIACLAIVECEWGEGNITMSLFLDMMPQKARNLLLAIEFSVNSVLFAILDYLLVKDVFAKLAKGTLTSELKYPRWIFSAVLAIGFIGMTLVLVVKTIIYFRIVKTGENVNFAELGRAD